MWTRARFISLWLLVSLSAAAFAGEARRPPPFERVPGDPVDRFELDFETGVLWRVGHNGTPLNYVVLPQLLTLKTPRVAHRRIGGRDLVLRSRFSLLVEPIVKGPETHYAGFSAAGILEWWNLERTSAFFFSSGGGFGGMDSRGYDVVGGQGQDFNFNWFLYPGVRFRRSDHFSASIGLYYQHVSNRDMDKINPGLDALGPLLSFGWHF